jgi:DNA-binding response OmpR family regulator
MSAQLLVVEDDADLREAMASALAADGHGVQVAADGHAALEALGDGGQDLVLLDIGLGSGPDGVEVCRRLRRADTDVYVMMLTAHDREGDVVLALEAGADDYVIKPVGIAELRSRVRAALRRLQAASARAAAGNGLLRHATLTLDPAAMHVTVAGTPVALTRSELAVLEALLRAGGAVQTRTQLLQAIYGDDAYRDPRNIDLHVHNIREKLKAAGGDPAVLVTVRGTGYRLAP